MKTTFFTALLSVALLSGGCHLFPNEVQPAGPVQVASTPPDIDWSQPLALDLDNQAGSVTIIVDATFRRAEVFAITTTDDGRRVAAPWAAADYQAAEPRAILRVLCKRGPNAGGDGKTDVTIRLPACAGLRVRNSIGPVLATGVSGAIDIQNGSDVELGGNVTVEVGSPLGTPMMLRSAGGSVRLDLPTSSRGLFFVHSGVNQISFVAPKEETQAGAADARGWNFDLNRGEHQVRLIADQGPVTVRVGL
ncbi:hypothetical protein PHYC_00177 [Phycisphaerales bacterium]|nr:hypothetical protein PHYC_00177 [Phycisphaerales bacterium]